MTMNFVLLSKLFPGLMEELEKEDSFSGLRMRPSGPRAQGNGLYDAAFSGLRIETSPSGHPTLLLGGRYVHSPRDPVQEARRLAGSLQNTGPMDSRPIVILGFGLGYSAEAAAHAAPGRPLIIVESRRAVLRKALETRDLTRLLTENKLVFVLGGKGDPAGAIQSALGLFYDPREAPASAPPIIRNRALIAADEEWYAGVEQGIKNFSSRDEVNAATLRRFGKRWVRNLGRNMESIRDLPGIEGLAGVLAAAAGGRGAGATRPPASPCSSPPPGLPWTRQRPCWGKYGNAA